MHPIEIDDNLSPENAHEQNYEWVQDSIYDPEAPKDANQDIVELLEKGYKLGRPASRADDPLAVGLYKLISH